MHSRSLGSMEVLMSNISIVSEAGHRWWQVIKKTVAVQGSDVF